MPQYVGQVYVSVQFDQGQATQALNQSLRGAGQAAGAQMGDAITTSSSKSLLAFGTQATRIGRQLSFGLAVPLAGVGHAADQAFESYDTNMTKVAALTGVGIDQTSAWSDEVLQLASNYGQTGEDAAKALYLITSSGIRGAEAMKTLDVVGKSAAVGLGDMATMAGLLTSVMNAYGASNIDAAKAADILSGAVQESKVPADEMAGSLSQLLPFGAQLGVGFDQLAGSMAALSLQGTNTAMAATQLRGIFNAMLDPSAQMNKGLAKIGLSAEQLQNTLKGQGVVAMIRQLRDAIVANGGDADSELANMFGNVRALTGVFGLLSNQNGQIDRVMQNTANSTGKLNAALEVTADTAGFKAKQAAAGLHNAMINLGEAVTPVKTFMVDFAANALNVVNALGPLKYGLAVVGAAFVALGPAVYTAGAIFDVMAGVQRLREGRGAQAAETNAAAAAEERLAASMQASATAQAEQAGAVAAGNAEMGQLVVTTNMAGETIMVNAQTGAVVETELAGAIEEVNAAQAQLVVTSNLAGETVIMNATAGTVATEAEVAAMMELNGAMNTTKASSVGLVASLGPMAAMVAAAGAAMWAWNKDADEATKKVDELADIFDNRIAKGSIADANQAIQVTQDQIDQMAKEANDMKWPWDQKQRIQILDAATALQHHVNAAKLDVQWSQQMAAATGESADVINQWLQNQRNGGATLDTYDQALQAFTRDVAKHGGTVTQAATAEGKLADKAKDLATGFFGVHDAFQNYVDSLDKVQKAEQAIGDAERAAQAARRDQADAIDKVTEANQRHRDALQKVTDAQNELASARQKYEELLKGPSLDERLDVREARLQMRRAQQAMSQPGSSLDREQRSIDLARARQRLQEAQGEHAANLAKAQDDVTKAQQGVTSAQKDVADTAKAITDAQLGVEAAHYRVRDADQAVVDAHKNLETATWNAGVAAYNLNTKQEEFQTLIQNSNAQLDPFIKYLETLKDKYPEVAAALQPAIDQANALNDAAKKAKDEAAKAATAPPPTMDGGLQYKADQKAAEWQKYLDSLAGINLGGTFRATGGPLAAGQLSHVNERGTPELWSAGGKQYLLPTSAGNVVPLKPVTNITVAGGDQPTVGTMNVYTSGDPVQSAYEVRRQLAARGRTRGRS